MPPMQSISVRTWCMHLVQLPCIRGIYMQSAYWYEHGCWRPTALLHVSAGLKASATLVLLFMCLVSSQVPADPFCWWQGEVPIIHNVHITVGWP